MNDNASLSTPSIESFLQEQKESAKPIEERLSTCLEFMKECLSKEGNPDFKAFWQVRQFCFPLFKEPISKHIRANLWTLYTELTREGRQLKSLLDVESSFAAEQISLAIEDLEKQVTAVIEGNESTITTDFTFPELPQALKASKELYFEKQRLLHLFNVFAARVHGLRKELIKTEMRIKQKNALFARLSALGDRVFPLRKELMHEVNEGFIQDVDQFKEMHFSEKTFSAEKVRPQVFFFRNEIKLFQTLAKSLSLDTRAFTQTRTMLSHCWDCLKGMEKELKKEFVEQKQLSAEHTIELKAEIEQLGQALASQELSCQEAQSKLDALQNKMRKTTLVRADVQQLKELIATVSKPIEETQQARRKQKQDQEAALEAERKDKICAFQKRVEAYLESLDQQVLPDVSEKLASLRQEQRSLVCNSLEKQKLDALLKQAKDRLMEKQEAAVLQLPAESRQVLDELNQLLDSRKARRAEIKAQLDDYRKILSGSSLDIEKAMSTQELLDQEKEVLEKCDASILEIEKKIKDLKHQR